MQSALKWALISPVFSQRFLEIRMKKPGFPPSPDIRNLRFISDFLSYIFRVQRHLIDLCAFLLERKEKLIFPFALTLHVVVITLFNPFF